MTMENTSTARDIMTQEPITVGLGADVAETARLMIDTQVRTIPVIDDDNRLLGIVTAASLFQRASERLTEHPLGWLEEFFFAGRAASAYGHLHGRRVTEVMTNPPADVAEDTPVSRLVEELHQSGLDRLPVTRHGKLVGVVTSGDVLRALARSFRDEPGAAPGDDGIRDHILRELRDQPWMRKWEIALDVRHAVVELHGRIFNDHLREGILAIAENAPGVKAVHDHLVWIGPAFSGIPIASPEDLRAQR